MWWYLGEAVPLFLVGTVLLFVLDRARRAACWISRGRRADRHRAARAAGRDRADLRDGLPAPRLRRGGLFQLAHTGQLTGVQAVVALTVMTLFVPCVANFLMIVKERGLRVGLAILAFVTPVAVFTGAGLNYVLHALGVHF